MAYDLSDVCTAAIYNCAARFIVVKVNQQVYSLWRDALISASERVRVCVRERVCV